MGAGGYAGAGLCVHGSSLHAQSIRLPLTGCVGREPKLARHFLKSVGPASTLHFPCCALWFVCSCLGLLHRKYVGQGQRLSVRREYGGRWIITKKKRYT